MGLLKQLDESDTAKNGTGIVLVCQALLDLLEHQGQQGFGRLWPSDGIPYRCRCRAFSPSPLLASTKVALGSVGGLACPRAMWEDDE
jgi:hypothetical protein